MSDKKHSVISEMKKSLALAFPHTIPVLTGFLFIGMTYGLVMNAEGHGILWAVLMSAIAFCGSMQFVGIALLAQAFNPLQALLLSLVVNARHLFYGIAMLDKYKNTSPVRPFLIYTLCDETFSICSSVEVPQNINKKYFYFSISFLDYIYWVAGTFLGAILGDIIPFDTKGIDFVLTALFIVLFLEQVKSKNNIIPGFIGIAASVLGLLIFGASNMIIPSMIIIFFIMIIARKKLCR